MPIEFRCTQCNLSLRTPDDTAGKQAKCPSCGTLVPIPSPDEATGAGTQGDDVPSAYLGPTGTIGPPGDSQANPYAEPPLVNPYQTPASPLGPGSLSRAELKSKLTGPAVGMIVGAALSILYSVANLIVSLTVGVEQLGAEVPNDPALRAVFHVLLVIVYIAVMIVPILVLVGSVSMLRMTSYTMAKTGAILALMPCTCCFVISLPFGIWGLLVLSDVHVRAAFQSNREQLDPLRNR